MPSKWGQFRLGGVEESCPDDKGVVRDIKVRICHSLPIGLFQVRKDKELCPSKILHRDVRRLVVLLPVEEQEGLRLPP